MRRESEYAEFGTALQSSGPIGEMRVPCFGIWRVAEGLGPCIQGVDFQVELANRGRAVGQVVVKGPRIIAVHCFDCEFATDFGRTDRARWVFCAPIYEDSVLVCCGFDALLNVFPRHGRIAKTKAAVANSAMIPIPRRSTVVVLHEFPHSGPLAAYSAVRLKDERLLAISHRIPKGVTRHEFRVGIRVKIDGIHLIDVLDAGDSGKGLSDKVAIPRSVHDGDRNIRQLVAHILQHWRQAVVLSQFDDHGLDIVLLGLKVFIRRLEGPFRPEQ